MAGEMTEATGRRLADAMEALADDGIGSRRRDQSDSSYEAGSRRGRTGGGGATSPSIVDRQWEAVFTSIANTAPIAEIRRLSSEFDRLADPQVLDRMQALQRQLGGIGGAGGEAFREGAGMVGDMRDTYLRFNEELAGSITSGNDAVSGLGVSLRSLLGDAGRTYDAFEMMTIGARGSANGFRFMQNETDETMLRMGLFGQQMDLRASEIATFQEREISLGIESGTMLENAAIAATRVADVYGDSGKEIMNIIEEIVSDTRRFGNVSETEAAKIGGALRQLGLDYGELGGMTDKFFDFEGAASSVSALTSVFGVQIDAMEAMRLANSPDRLDFLTYMRDQFMASGRAVEDMTLAEKRLIQQQLGLSDIQAVERLFDPTVDLENLDAIDEAANRGTTSLEGSIEELETQIKNFGDGTDDALERVRDASRDAFTAGMQRDIMATITTAEDLIGTMELVGQAGGRELADSDQFGFLQQGLRDMEAFVSSMDGSIGEIQQGLILAFTGDGTEANPGITATIIKELGDAFEALLNDPRWRSRSPSLAGLAITGGVIKALQELSPEARKSFDAIGKEGDKFAAKQLDGWSKEIGKLGMKSTDFGKSEIEKLASDFGTTTARVESAINANLKNTKQRDKAQKIETHLEGIMNLGDKQLVQNRLSELARYYKVSKASLESYTSGKKDQDAIFKDILDTKKKDAEKAEKKKKEDAAKKAEGKDKPEVNSKADESNKESIRAIKDAKTAQLKAETELEELKSKLESKKGEDGIINLTINPADVILEVSDREIGRAALNAFSSGTPVLSDSGKSWKVVLKT